MTQLMSLPYTIEAKGCVTGVPQLPRKRREAVRLDLHARKQKGRRKAGLS
ncbi:MULTISPECIES: hypothetical protein [unclassified Bradyrhizobium]